MKGHILVTSYRDIRHPHWGGAEVIMYEVFRRIRRAGFKVSFLCSNFPGGGAVDEVDGMRIHRIGNTYDFNFRVPGFLRGFARREGVTLVAEDVNKIPFFSPRFLRGIPTLGIVPHLFGKTVFQEVAWPLAAYVYAYEQLIPRVYRNCYFSVLSDTTKEDLVSRGLRAERIRVIRSGIDHEEHKPPPVRESAPGPVLVYLGRLKKYKRIDLAILAMPRILESVPDAQYWIVGEGDHRKSLEALVAAMGLGNSVRFCGLKTGVEKLEILHRSRILVYTSPKEGWGLSVIEANATGCPAVASDSPGLKESVRDGQTGFLVPHGDVPALAETLVRLLKDDDLWMSLSRAGIDWARQYTWERSAAETLDLIEEVLRVGDGATGAAAGGSGGEGAV